MNKNSILLYSLLFIFLISLGFGYYRVYISKDFLIQVHTPCDTKMNSCFVESCQDGLINCKEGSFYEEITKKASNIFRQCGDEISDCKITCEPGEIDCSVNFCEPSADNTCSDSTNTSNVKATL